MYSFYISIVARKSHFLTHCPFLWCFLVDVAIALFSFDYFYYVYLYTEMASGSSNQRLFCSSCAKPCNLHAIDMYH